MTHLPLAITYSHSSPWALIVKPRALSSGAKNGKLKRQFGSSLAAQLTANHVQGAQTEQRENVHLERSSGTTFGQQFAAQN